jgi:D-alanyl-D-alanine carboxypeptidase
MLAIEGNRASFKEGDVYTVHDLIVSMMTVSSNNAAEAVALYTGKDIFVVRMNEMATRLGMTDTHFDDPTGLSVKNVSTITDIEILARYVLRQYPEIFELSTNKTNVINPVFSNTPRTLYNINTFAGRTDFLGGKTGFLPESGGNLVSAFKKNGSTIIITVFGTVDRFSETQKILNQL